MSISIGTHFISGKILNSDNAVSSTASTVELGASASSVDDTYNNKTIEIVSGTGVGQIRDIDDYDGGTKVADISPNWTTNPDATSLYYIRSGITLGQNNNYPHLKAAFDDITAALTGNIDLIISSDIVDPPKAILNGVNFNGFRIRITNQRPPEGVARQGYRHVLTLSQEVVEFIDCTNGNLVIQNQNLVLQTSSPVGVTEKVVALTGASQTINALIHDNVLQGGQRGSVGIHLASDINFSSFNNTITNFYDSGTPQTGYGIEVVSTGAVIKCENEVLHKCGSGIVLPASQTGDFYNILFLDNYDDLYLPGASNAATGNNCGTNKSSLIGFNTETDTVLNGDIRVDVWSEDPSNFNFLRLKSEGAFAQSGIVPSSLQIPENVEGARGNQRGYGNTTSIGADEAVKLTRVDLRNVPPQGGPGATASHLFSDSITKDIPDKGSNYVETRLLILDHGKESPNEAGRDPEWVDFTEIGGIYRLGRIPEAINIGTEGVKPFRFKASSLSLRLQNSDFAFDNLKRVDLQTVNGNQAKFLETVRGTNLDLQFRPAKLVTKFPKANMTVSYDIGNFKVNSFMTDSSGKATLKLDSNEKEFIETKADKVKDGKNWYFDRSIKFLAQELIKSVRREYSDGREDIVGTDTVSLAGIETDDGSRIFSEYGRPIADVNPLAQGTLPAGEKRMIVTAAVARNIFRSFILTPVSAGSSFIRIRMDEAIEIKKGDILTIGKTTGSDFDDLNEEKVVVLEDVTFSGTPLKEKLIKVSNLKKDHAVGEAVERWMIYIGCTRDIEDPYENYLLAFDPDRDEYANLSQTGAQTGDKQGYFINPPRFLHLNHSINAYAKPTLGKLMMASSAHAFPGKPNEAGRLYIWSIDLTKRWDDYEQIILEREQILFEEQGGCYTGEMNFRSLKPMLTPDDLGVIDPDLDVAVANYGAAGVGKFVEEVLHQSGYRILGFGYLAGLAENVLEETSKTIRVATKADGAKVWGVHPISFGGTVVHSGTIFLIGGNENTDGEDEGVGETFYENLNFYSARITGVSSPEQSVVEYTTNSDIVGDFNKNNTVVIVIPDGGKMYVGNLGENTVIPKAQDLQISEWLGDESSLETSVLDGNTALEVKYHDRIRHEQKKEIDRANPETAILKKKVDALSVEPGYYSTIVEKRKLAVDFGDEIVEDNDQVSYHFRIVPGQYVAMPFATELSRLYFNEVPVIDEPVTSELITKQISDFNTSWQSYPDNARGIIGDAPPIVYEGTDGNADVNGNLPDVSNKIMEAYCRDENGVLRNRNAHIWNFPVVGLWCKYEELTDSMTAFDGSVLADNGNAELLGYWYLDYENPVAVHSNFLNAPKLEVAYSDAKGIANVDESPNLPDAHFPLCTVLHNVTHHNGGPGTETLDFYGDISTEMQERIKFIMGGVFNLATSYEDGSSLTHFSTIGQTRGGANAFQTPFKYLKWDSFGSQFNTKFPLNMATMPSYSYQAIITLKFKRLRNPQAKGNLFIANHCYPVRPRHLHLPYGRDEFNGSITKDMENEGIGSKAEVPTNAAYSYLGKSIDTNFELGSEELLNQGKDDDVANIWVLDRFSQRKSLGMFTGYGDDYDDGGILRGAAIDFVEDGELEIEVPLGYKGGLEGYISTELKYLRNATEWTVQSVTEQSLLGVDYFTFKFTGAHGLGGQAVGTLLKMNGCKEVAAPVYYEHADGLYRVSAVPAVDEVQVEKIRVNDLSQNATHTASYITNSFFDKGKMKRYYGINIKYEDSAVATAMIDHSGTDDLYVTSRHEIGGVTYEGFLHQISVGDIYIYDPGEGRLSYKEEDGSDLVFFWNRAGGNPVDAYPTYLRITAITATGPLYLDFTSVQGFNLDVSIPEYVRQVTDHKDHLYGQPAGSERFPILAEKTFLSYKKELFNCPPSFADFINYPMVLCGRNWEKFWYYNERRPTDDFKNKLQAYAIGSMVPNKFSEQGGFGQGTVQSDYRRPRIILSDGLDYVSVGAPSSTVTSGDRTFTVLADTYARLYEGQYLKLDDGTNEDNLGEIILLDDATKEVTCRNKAVNTFSISLTSIKVTNHFVMPDLVPTQEDPHTLGSWEWSQWSAEARDEINSLSGFKAILGEGVLDDFPGLYVYQTNPGLGNYEAQYPITSIQESGTERQLNLDIGGKSGEGEIEDGDIVYLHNCDSATNLDRSTNNNRFFKVTGVATNDITGQAYLTPNAAPGSEVDLTLGAGKSMVVTKAPNIHIATFRQQEMDYGKAVLATSTTIKLANSASGSTGAYNDMIIYIREGTGVGQKKRIISYNGPTRTATVSAWALIPDNTSVYRVEDLDTYNLASQDYFYNNGFETNSFAGGSAGNRFHLAESNPYGEGDGTFDSGIKPLSFTSNFIDILPKWYLSRSVGTPVLNGDPLIWCDTYTGNQDSPFLGDDSRLYAIVNHHPGKNNAGIARFPFIRFCLDAERNFLGSGASDEMFFTRAKFIKDSNEMQIRYSMWILQTTGITQLAEVMPPNFSDPDGVERSIKSDWEIHGIYGTNKFGVMKWVNKGNVSTTRVDGTYRADNRYFSLNSIVVNNGGTYSVYPYAQGTVPSVFYGSYLQANWSFTVDTTNSFVYKYIGERPNAVYRGGSPLTKVPGVPGAGQYSVGFKGYFWLVVLGVTTDPDNIYFHFANAGSDIPNDYRTSNYDGGGNFGFLGFVKKWTDDYENITISSYIGLGFHGSIMRRHYLVSDDENERNRREDLIGAITEANIGGYTKFDGTGTTMFPYEITSIRKFDFRIFDANGYYFTNNFENDLRRWNGSVDSDPIVSPVIDQIAEGLPTVEGDFNQYSRMVKIDSPYEEIFGFSMGPKIHMASQTFRGGRNIIWKLSKALAFHIAVADFEDLSVWDALGNFAELSDCIVGFDRYGNLHFEPRPEITENSPFFFTFDNVEDQNVLKIVKKPAFQHIYNEIEIIPSKPTLPDVTANMVTQSDLNVVTVNHDLFIRDQSLEFNEKSQNKARPNIFAFQKDFKRKRIVLVCNNGQFSAKPPEAKGLYSRFKYQLIDDVVELRITEAAITGGTTLKLNHIPFDSVINDIAIQVDDYLQIGSLEFQISIIDTDTKTITITPAIPADTRFEAGMPVSILNLEQHDRIFFADGDGKFPYLFSGQSAGFTFSPKPYFVEIGEWTFDERESRPRKAVITADIGPASTTIPLDDATGFPEKGIISVGGRLVSYNGIDGKRLKVNSSIPSDFSPGVEIHSMPSAPFNGRQANTDYDPGDIRIGGYDELGPSCMNEYHMLDPNEDGQPYYDADPNLGGRPITALEFYAKKQRLISYYDAVTKPTGNHIIANEVGGTDYRVRNRTHVNMKIDFAGFRFSDGDRIELDVPGIKLKQQVHLKQVFSDYESIKRNGLRQYPATKNRFFTQSTALIFAKRNLNRIMKIGAQIEVQALISDVNELDWLNIVRIVDSKMFSGYPNNEVKGYITSLKFDQNQGIVTATVLTQEA